MDLFVLPFRNRYWLHRRFAARSSSRVHCSRRRSNLQVRTRVLPIDRSIHLTVFRRRRRARTLKYLKNDDDHRQHLNGNSDAQHRPMKPLQIEHPHFLPTSPTIISTPSGANQPRSNHLHENLSDREALLKPADRAYPSSTSIDDSYDEIIDIADRHAHFPLAQQSPYLEAEERKYVLPSKPSREVFYYAYDG